MLDKTRLIRNLKVFGTVLILTVSSYHVSGDVINPDNDFVLTIEREQNIDNLEDYVLQGLCKVEDKYLLSAYNHQHENSIIYVLDENLEEYYIKELDTNSHVGGITYDPKNHNVWITDNDGCISAYDKDDMFNQDRYIKSKYKNVYVGDELNNIFGDVSAAYITCHDNKLYVGNFNFKPKSIIKEYSILDSGMIDEDNYNKYNISQFVQGITFYEKDGINYLITSSSFGTFLPSKLQIYDFDTLEKVNEIKTQKMMEEILVDGDQLITLYEGNANIYKSDDNDKDIIIMDINKVLTK